MCVLAFCRLHNCLLIYLSICLSEYLGFSIDFIAVMCVCVCVCVRYMGSLENVVFYFQLNQMYNRI